MTYDEFKERFTSELDKIKDELGIDYNIGPIHKNNVYYDGLSVIPKNPTGIAPLTYLNLCYEDFKTRAGVIANMKGYVKDVVVNMMEKSNRKNFALTDICRDNANYHLLPCVCDYKNNRDWLIDKGIPFKLIADNTIAVYPRWMLTDEASIVVNSDMMARLQMTKDEIFSACNKHMADIGYTATPIENVIAGITGQSETEEQGIMYVVRFNSNTYGAGILANSQIVSEIYKQINPGSNQEMVLIPSSVHELICLPVTDGFDLSKINAIIREVNETAVDITDRLGDEAMVYDGQTLRVASIKEQEKLKIANTITVSNERRMSHGR